MGWGGVEQRRRVGSILRARIKVRAITSSQQVGEEKNDPKHIFALHSMAQMSS